MKPAAIEFIDGTKAKKGELARMYIQTWMTGLSLFGCRGRGCFYLAQIWSEKEKHGDLEIQ